MTGRNFLSYQKRISLMIMRSWEILFLLLFDIIFSALLFRDQSRKDRMVFGVR